MPRIPISEARERLAECAEMLRAEAVILERFGRPAAILINPDRYEELLEAIAEVQDAVAYDQTAVSDDGGNIPWERVKADLGWT